MSPDDVPHPRDTTDFVGHTAAIEALREGERSGRLHHAWLLGGPPGIGKATLAYRFARWLIASPSERLGGPDGLAVDPEGRTSRQMSALSHPNLISVERVAPEEGKPVPKQISVDAIRKALSFFTTTAADGGRRICIVDAADDLNTNAANALLKTVEEPPTGALILLVSHAPQRLLPTIRSRCRKLGMNPLAEPEVAAVLRGLDPEGDAALRERVVGMAEGSIGRALSLMDPKRVALIDELTALLEALPRSPTNRILALADRLGDRRGADEMPLVLDTVQAWLASRIGEGAARGPARLAPLAEVCENVTEAARSVEIYNLDRRAFIVSTFGDLAEAVRRAA